MGGRNSAVHGYGEGISRLRFDLYFCHSPQIGDAPIGFKPLACQKVGSLMLDARCWMLESTIFRSGSVLKWRTSCLCVTAPRQGEKSSVCAVRHWALEWNCVAVLSSVASFNPSYVDLSSYNKSRIKPLLLLPLLLVPRPSALFRPPEWLPRLRSDRGCPGRFHPHPKVFPPPRGPPPGRTRPERTPE